MRAWTTGQPRNRTNKSSVLLCFTRVRRNNVEYLHNAGNKIK